MTGNTSFLENYEIKKRALDEYRGQARQFQAQWGTASKDLLKALEKFASAVDSLEDEELRAAFRPYVLTGINEGDLENPEILIKIKDAMKAARILCEEKGNAALGMDRV